MLDMSYGFIKQEWFAKLQFRSLGMKRALYDEYYRDSCIISKENMISFLKANSVYSLKEDIKNTKAKIYIFVGEKEQSIMIRSAQKLHERISNSILEVKDGMIHGDFSINHAKEYADKVLEILEIGK